ncbi:Furin, partial, partial [Paramuricea clavata]
MTDFARPTMRDNPDHIIIHIGTNDVRQSNPEDVIRNVENLCNQIKDQCPRTTISLSELIVRNDFPDATTKISKINNELLCLSRSKGYYLINNSNISVQNLDRYGLHLN